MFSDYNPKIFSSWSAWLIASGTLMLIYEITWIRYFVNPTLKNFYGKFIIIPLPLAMLPVAAFLLLGIYGKVIWLILSVLILGIGHIGIHLQHYNTVKNNSITTK